MDKRTRLAVQVRDKMFGPFGQTEDGTEIDDLGGDGTMVGKLLRQQPQILIAKLSHNDRFVLPLTLQRYKKFCMHANIDVVF